MIKLRIFPLENDIEFNENYINILEIENKTMFTPLIYSLNRLINYNEESEAVILLEENKRLSISKDVIIIHDLFNIDVNESKILKALHLDIENQYMQQYSEMNLLENFTEVIKNINDIISSYDFEFEYKKE
ncbi:type II-A CRISPR-associated protein Csn2 [Clostridium estertheticum]|uniref:type II-A CRISPR-associated protein Csn2 n=1 Tax=Clostridium estertheticum TaxID=238834 RepID=UPI0013EE89D7|nr:type II-A CRISPR-associated protein Csn2 [Clostridium estertheticum]MBZ9607274.1 type II-A CRISPR-associated protein Csn2 [Clostridium estertheticum]